MGGSSSTVSNTLIPAVLAPLFQNTARQMMGLQNALPLYPNGGGMAPPWGNDIFGDPAFIADLVERWRQVRNIDGDIGEVGPTTKTGAPGDSGGKGGQSMAGAGDPGAMNKLMEIPGTGGGGGGGGGGGIGWVNPIGDIPTSDAGIGANWNGQGGSGPTDQIKPGGIPSGPPDGQPQIPPGGGPNWSTGNPIMPDYSWGDQLGEGQFIGYTPRQIAGLSPLEYQAAGMIPQLGQMSQYGNKAYETLLGVQGGGMQNPLSPESMAMTRLRDLPGMAENFSITNDSIINDPAYKAAIAAFEQANRPMIQNSAALSGVGRGTALANAEAMAQSQYLLPTIQDTIARQERGLDRRIGTTLATVNPLMGLGQMQLNRQMGTINPLMGLEQLGAGRQQAQFGALGQMGALGRDVAQQRMDSDYNDFLRRQALAEQALFTPFGSFTPSAFGAQTRQSGGGMFK